MRVLVYGAGALGSYLAHRLHRGGIDTTLLARGDWKSRLERYGLTFRHYAQLHTTRDRIPVVDSLRPEDRYDVIFVVMQHTQVPTVLPLLAANPSPNVVFVGNNARARETREDLLRQSLAPKQVWFGFQSSGGRREKDRVVCVRMCCTMTLGSLENSTWDSMPEQALLRAGYRIRWFDDMDAWLKCHLAFILPVVYACYLLSGDLRKADKSLIYRLIDAVDEGYQALIALGILILPQGDETYPREKRRQFYAILRIMCRTPIGRLAASDHAMAAVGEMTALDREFTELCDRSGVAMPAWRQLRQASGIERMEQ